MILIINLMDNYSSFIYIFLFNATLTSIKFQLFLSNKITLTITYKEI